MPETDAHRRRARARRGRHRAGQDGDERVRVRDRRHEPAPPAVPPSARPGAAARRLLVGLDRRGRRRPRRGGDRVGHERLAAGPRGALRRARAAPDARPRPARGRAPARADLRRRGPDRRDGRGPRARLRGARRGSRPVAPPPELPARGGDRRGALRRRTSATRTVAAVLRAAIARLGLEVEPVALDIADAAQVHHDIQVPGGRSARSPSWASTARACRRSCASARPRRRGSPRGARAHAAVRRGEIAGELAFALAQHDVLLAPCLAGRRAAARPADASTSAAAGDRASARRCCPARSRSRRARSRRSACPAGEVDGLPVGLQIVGPPGSDEMLIALAGRLAKSRRNDDGPAVRARRLLLGGGALRGTSHTHLPRVPQDVLKMRFIWTQQLEAVRNRPIDPPVNPISSGRSAVSRGALELMPQSGREVVIVEAVRTPIGRGHARRAYYKDVHANALLAQAYTAVIERAGHRPRPRSRTSSRAASSSSASRASTSRATRGCRRVCRSRRPRRPSTASAARRSRP